MEPGVGLESIPLTEVEVEDVDAEVDEAHPPVLAFTPVPPPPPGESSFFWDSPLFADEGSLIGIAKPYKLNKSNVKLCLDICVLAIMGYLRAGGRNP